MWVFGILTLPLCEGCFGDFFFARVHAFCFVCEVDEHALSAYTLS